MSGSGARPSIGPRSPTRSWLSPLIPLESCAPVPTVLRSPVPAFHLAVRRAPAAIGVTHGGRA